MKFSAILFLSAATVARVEQGTTNNSLLGQWIAQYPGQEITWLDGNKTKASENITYLLTFQVNGQAILQPNDLKPISYQYRLVTPTKIALYNVARKKHTPTYILIKDGNSLRFYCPSKLSSQESIDLVYELKFTKKQ
ncbi:MAG: hypothetical protein ACRYG7_15775 [Janthinobacterium lividum]